MTFGDEKTIAGVDLLIIKLQERIKYNGEEYGPYLENFNYLDSLGWDYFKPYKFTKITIDYNEISVDVFIEPSEKDIIVFKQ